jgi:dipeptidyl aminopeptidase/acylaminoacyl peptidase
MKIIVAAAIAALGVFDQSLSATGEQQFLEFPLATQTVAARNGGAFAWLIRQGGRTQLRYARAPKFEPQTLVSIEDGAGQPPTDVALSPDGEFVAYTTGNAFGGEQPYNPASLLAPAGPAVWVTSIAKGATARLGPGVAPVFASSGARLLYRHDKDLLIADVTDSGAQAGVVTVPGGAKFADIQWSPDGTSIAFVQDRGGYAFLGLYRPGADRVHWLVTGPDRAASPTWSPDGRQLAYLEFPGREHTRKYDKTESEPLAVKVVDAGSGVSRMLWQTSSRATANLEDHDSALRWVGSDRVVFYSEHDGWGRLYSVAAAGGEPVALTPANCEVAESELVGATELFVVHNCSDLHTRQASIIDVKTHASRPAAAKDVVIANAAAAQDKLILFTGGDADAAPLPRILDLKTGKVLLREAPSSYGYAESFKAPPPQVVTLQAEDGVSVPTQLFLPRSKRANAALIFVHGGPPRQMFPAFHFSEYHARTYAINRHLAELGYVVLSVNYRSGVGYGRTFREAENRGWNGASEYRDVLAAGRWLAKRPDVDPSRIGIWGGSYGGLLTAQALARNSDLFAAGVAIHGVFDWSWPSPRAYHLNPSDFFGVSDPTRARAFASSPLAAVDQWRSPVLLFSGDMDANVDVAETVDLTQKLRARSVDVRTVLVPGEAHGFVLHATWQQLWQEMAAFFGEKLGERKHNPRPPSSGIAGGG